MIGTLIGCELWVAQNAGSHRTLGHMELSVTQNDSSHSMLGHEKEKKQAEKLGHVVNTQQTKPKLSPMGKYQYTNIPNYSTFELAGARP